VVSAKPDNWDEIGAQLIREALARRNRTRLDFEDAKRAALDNLGELIDDLIPKSSRGKTRCDELWCCNPYRLDENPTSFSINIRTGQYYDFATKESGNIFTLWRQVKGLADNTEAMFSIAKFLNVPERKVRDRG
jgi:hypothetical protein